MKKTYIILGILVIGILAGTTIFIYEWNRKPREVRDTEAAHSLTMAELFTAFKTDTVSAAKKFSGTVVKLSGKVDETEEDALGNISAIFHGDGIDLLATFKKSENKNFAGIKSGNQITFKGEYIGFEMDDIIGLPVVKLDKCVLEDR